MEYTQWLVAFDIFEQNPHRHPRSGKAGGARKNVGVGGDGATNINAEFVHAPMIPARRSQEVEILLRARDKAHSIFFTAQHTAAMLRTLVQPNAKVQEAIVM